jgi:hypothetical protein
MAKKKKQEGGEGATTVIEVDASNLKSFTGKLKKLVADETAQAERAVEITSAAIKDDFCNYSYEVVQGIGSGDTHSVKGSGIIEDDLRNAFAKLNVHLAIMDNVYKHAGIPGAVVISGETEQLVRDRILTQFKTGKIRCVINVGVLTTGFDYPELDTVLICRSTMSLALYYQIVGRVMRPHPSKETAWVVDLGGNVKFFGKIEDLQIRCDTKGQYSVWNSRRQLTNITFTKE